MPTTEQLQIEIYSYLFAKHVQQFFFDSDGFIAVHGIYIENAAVSVTQHAMAWTHIYLSA